MRDAASELADRLHLLRLAELLLESAPLAHILGDDFVTLHAAILEAHRAAVETHRDRLGILAPPHCLAFDGPGSGVHLREIAGARGRLFEDVAIEIAARQLRLRLISQHVDERWIHRQEGALGSRAEDTEGGLLDQHAIGSVGAARCFFRAPTLGDVRRHTHDAGDAAIALAHR